MDFEPSEEQQMLIDQVRRFVREEIIPLEAKMDPDASELDPADHKRLVEKTKAMGLFGIDIPKEYGGPDIDIVTRVLLAIEMAQHRAGLYVPCYGTFGGAGLAQIFEANDDQKERYLYPTLRGEKKAFFGLTEPFSTQPLSLRSALVWMARAGSLPPDGSVRPKNVFFSPRRVG